MQHTQEKWVKSLGQEMATHSVTVAWNIPQRGLADCSPQGNKESDVMKRLSTHTCIRVYIFI